MYRFLAVLLAVQVLATLFNLVDNLPFPVGLMLAQSIVQTIVLAYILEKMNRENSVS